MIRYFGDNLSFTERLAEAERFHMGTGKVHETLRALVVDLNREEGEYPGDGKPKPVVFPEPALASEDIEGIKVVSLPVLINLKLASGMTAPHRLRDLADVQDLIRLLQLPRAYADQLDSSVRDRFQELHSQVDRDDTGAE